MPLAIVKPVSGFGLRISGFGFRVSGFRFRASNFGFLVSGFGFLVSGFWFLVSGFGVQGFGLRVAAFGFRVSGSDRNRRSPPEGSGRRGPDAIPEWHHHRHLRHGVGFMESVS